MAGRRCDLAGRLEIKLVERTRYGREDHEGFMGSALLSLNITGVGRWTAAAEGKPRPNVTKIKRLYDPAGDKLILQRAGADSRVGSNLKDFFCGDGAGINAGVMLATAQVWHRFAEQFQTFVYGQLLSSDWLANEQMVFKVWTSRNASQFAIVEHKCPGDGCKSADSEVPVIDWSA